MKVRGTSFPSWASAIRMGVDSNAVSVHCRYQAITRFNPLSPPGSAFPRALRGSSRVPPPPAGNGHCAVSPPTSQNFQM